MREVEGRSKSKAPEVTTATLTLEELCTAALEDLAPDAAEAAELCPISKQTPLEEHINVLTHGFGLVVSVFATLLFGSIAGLYGTGTHVVACAIFGLTMIAAFGSSTFYHLAPTGAAKRHLQTFDHICIYLLIAGSYTPFLLLGIESASLKWGFLAFAWVTATVGTVFKITTERNPVIETLLYLGMGWAALFLIVPLSQSLPTEGFAFLIAGGLIYTAGVAFYMLDRIPFNHGIWHVFVVAGGICHLVSVYVSFLS